MAIRDFGLPPREPEKPYLVPSRRPGRWKRVVLWIAGIILTLILVLAISVHALLHSASFHNYVLRTVEKNASESLNTQVRLQTFAVHLSNLGLDLYGLTVFGVGPGANAALLQVDRISLGVRIVSVLHRQWSLASVMVDHPVGHLIVNSNGQSNLPSPRCSGNSNVNLFDVAIRRILLERGEAYYNDRKSALNADLRDLTMQANYDAAAGGRYLGTLSYRDGHLQYGTYAPIPHDLRAQFDVRRSGLALNNVTLSSGQSQLLLNASLENYVSPMVHAKYVIILATGEFRCMLKNPALPVGTVLVNGSADYSSVAGRTPLDTTSLEGTIRSSVLQLRSPALRAEVRDFSAGYSLANGNAELRDISARLLGGELRGTATVRNLAGKQQGHVILALRDLSLVTTTQNAAVQMQYRVNRKWSVSGVRDENGGFGLDGRYHKDL